MTLNKETAQVNCPECRAKMHKIGKVWSGRNRVQRYRCPNCGRTTINSKAQADASGGKE